MIIDLQTQVWSSLDQLGREAAQNIRTRTLSAPAPVPGVPGFSPGSSTVGSGQIDASPAAHDRAMDCVALSVVIGYRSTLLGARIPKEYVAEFVSKDPNRRIGVAGVDPMASEDGVAQVDDAAALGLIGVAVSPVCQGFHPAHSAAMRVYERCAELSMPLFVRQQHPLTRSSVLEFGRPSAWDEVARALPSLRIVISQLGHPWIDETLTMLAKHENVFADISGVASRPWQLYTSLLNALGMGVMDKLLFGSGFPFDAPAGVIETLYTINTQCHGTQLPSIPRAAIRNIVERDSLACLGVETDHLAISLTTEHDGAESASEAEIMPAPMLRRRQMGSSHS